MAQPIKEDFPIFTQSVNGKRLCYLDSAASAQKPLAVIGAVDRIIATGYSNVHRGAHSLGGIVTEAFEGARGKVAKFINARSDNEIVFTSNTTDAINLVAACFGETLKTGDEIILSELEHHANIVPWYFLKQRKGVVLKIIPVTVTGELDMAEFEKMLSPKTKLVAVTQMSNTFGTVTPIKEIINKAHAFGAKVLIDGSQGIVHCGADMQELDCDFYAFTGHKLYAYTGIGVLYGREELLNALPPYQGGGDMIEKVSFDEITFKPAPARFEAGTPPILEAISLGAAIDYLATLDMKELRAEENKLLTAAEDGVKGIGGIDIYSNADNRAAILSFNLQGAHHHDVSSILDKMGVEVRAGHMCCQPLMKKLGIDGVVRASFAIYNDMADVEQFVQGVAKAKKMLG